MYSSLATFKKRDYNQLYIKYCSPTIATNVKLYI